MLDKLGILDRVRLKLASDPDRESSGRFISLRADSIRCPRGGIFSGDGGD